MLDPRAATYDSDCLAVWNKDVSFLRDPRFVAAYRRGMSSGHHIARAIGSNDDIHIEWRVHVLLWAASHGVHLQGDFVECGVNTGIFSLAICEYLNFNHLAKNFYLFDTFAGIPVEQMTQLEMQLGRLHENQTCYSECFEMAKRNFAPFPRAQLIRGRVPETLHQVQIDKVCYLSIDMNILEPELAAINFFWDKLSPGAFVVLDDYGWANYPAQKQGMDAFAASKGVSIVTLPTGQGLLVKPPSRV